LLPRINYVFRGFLLLFSFSLLFGLFCWLVLQGKPADVVNRIGILLEIIGVVSVAPDLIGEERLGALVLKGAVRLKQARASFERFLYATEEDDISEPYSDILAYLFVVGNSIVCVLLVMAWVGLWDGPVLRNWEYTILWTAFAFLSFEAISWMVLFLLFVISPERFQRVSTLYEFFVATNSFISSMGVLVVAAIVFLLNAISPFLVSLAKQPIRKTLVRITLPFVVSGALLQFVSTFL